MHLGNATPDNVYEDRLKRMAVNQCCTLIYTVSLNIYFFNTWYFSFPGHTEQLNYRLYFCFLTSLERLAHQRASC